MTTVSEWVKTVLREMATDDTIDTMLPLAEFQAVAASRLVDIVERWGGALLADDVGLGKTRVALSVAKVVAARSRSRRVHGPIMCVVPSRTRQHWRQTAVQLGIPATNLSFVTHAAMSRGALDTSQSPVFVIVDEAHRFRNRNAKRRANLVANLHAPVLLCTATPVVNTIDDLRSLLEIFLVDADVESLIGFDLATAFALAEQGRCDLTELLREVAIRRVSVPDSQEGFGRRPSTTLRVVNYDPGVEELWLWRNLEETIGRLTLVAFGGDWPRALFTEHVLRLWESGPDALGESVSELVDFHQRWLESASQGRRLERSEFRTVFGAAPGQAVFPFLFSGRPGAPAPDEKLAVEADYELLVELHDRLEKVRSADEGRTRLVAELAREGNKLLVFTSYRRAARGLYDRLCDALGTGAKVGLVTGDGARATGLGSVPADEVLRRFSPASYGASLRNHESLDVLVATDCLAEGVNLQDCGRVVLADLPYTPVAVQQRVGRLVRPGGPHDTVVVYLPRPRAWNDSLGMKRRLGAKLREARSVAMSPDSVLEAHEAGPNPLATLDALERLSRDVGSPGRPVPQGAWVADEHPTLWIVLAEVLSDRRRPWLFGVDDHGQLISLDEVLVELSDLAYADREITDGSLPDVVADVMESRRRFLESARLAPPSLELDAPEVEAWKLLRCSDLLSDELEGLRPRLLRRHTVATRRVLQRLTERGDVRGLARYVGALEARGNRTVVVEMRWLLGIRRS